MVSKCCKILSILPFLTILIPSGLCQTNVEGHVQGNWNLEGSPYIVIDNIRITERSRLEIDPGVEILFTGAYSFTVQGTVLAFGSSDNPIRFSGIDDDVTWRRIIFDFWVLTDNL